MFDNNPFTSNQKVNAPLVDGVDLVLSDFSFSDTIWEDGESITLNWTTANVGNQFASLTVTGLYLSQDNIVNNGDLLIHAPAQPFLLPGQSIDTTTEITLDFALMGIVPGLRFVSPMLNYSLNMAEYSYSNNATEAPPYVLLSDDGSDPLSSALSILAFDRTIIGNLSGSDTVDYYSYTAFSDGTTAIGLSDTAGDADVIVLDSVGQIVDLSTHSNEFDDILAFNQSIGETYYVIVQSDGQSTTSYDLTFDFNADISGPDTIAQNLTISTSIVTQFSKVHLGWDIVNIGDDNTNVASAVYISTDQNITTDDILLYWDASTGTLSPGEVNSEGLSGPDVTPQQLFYNTVLAEGVYYIGAIANHDGVGADIDPTNNVSNVIEIVIADRQDITGDMDSEFMFGFAQSERFHSNLGDLDLVWTGDGYDSVVFFTELTGQPDERHVDVVLDFDIDKDVIEIASGVDFRTYDLARGTLVVAMDGFVPSFSHMMFVLGEDVTGDEIIFDIVF